MRILVRNTLFDSPSFNKWFEMQTNGRDFQLGEIIIQ